MSATEKIKRIVVTLQLRKIAGVILIIVGLFLHLIPLFPAGWIIVLGLELVGIRLLLQDKIKLWCADFKAKLKNIFKRKVV